MVDGSVTDVLELGVGASTNQEGFIRLEHAITIHALPFTNDDSTLLFQRAVELSSSSWTKLRFMVH